MQPDDPRHGTTAGWHAHQKYGDPSCAPCRRAIAGYQAARTRDANYGRSRSVDATGTRRRIQALVAIGYTFKDIGVELGVVHDVARQIAQHRKWVRRETAERVAEAYERLAMKPLTGTQSSRYARTVAARHDWVPPLAWDDIDNDPEPADNSRPCVRPSCAGSVVALGLCRTHYNAQLREKAA